MRLSASFFDNTYTYFPLIPRDTLSPYKRVMCQL